jgi:hypothetical protein
MEKQIGRAEQWTPTWRGSSIRVGGRYMTTKSVRSFPADESLCEGEIVVYQGSGYSRYDPSSIYAFISESGPGRSWLLHDDEPIEHWLSLFAEL